MKLGQNFCLNNISYELKLDYVQPKTTPLGQILEKICVYILEATFSVQYSLDLVRTFALMTS